MKNYIVILFLLGTLFSSCEKDETYDEPNSFSDVGWYFSDTEGKLAISIDDYITFSDLSQGVLSHEWTIEEGNYYLKHPIQRTDSVFDDKIIGSGTTTDKTVSVLFKKSGLQNVRLNNSFKDSVTFRGVINDGKDKVFIPSKKVDGNWVIDTTFVIDVYAKIVSKVRVEQNGVV